MAAKKTISQRQPFKVYARWRPVLSDESAAEIVRQSDDDHETRASEKAPTLLAVKVSTFSDDATTKKVQSKGAQSWKSAKAFTHVFESLDENHTVFSRVVLPQVDQIMQGGTSNYFAYGHSGSGKTHTVFGYNEKGQTGLCVSAAQALFEAIEPLNAKAGFAPLEGNTSENVGLERLGVGIRLYELRHKTAVDLLNGRQECHVREGEDGRVHIRGQTEMMEEGKVRVRPIVTLACWTIEQLRSHLQAGMHSRSMGTSTVHDESSRTHAVLELEIINQALLSAREAVSERHSELVPVGKRATDIYLEESMKTLMKDAEGKWVTDPSKTRDDARVEAAEAEKKEHEQRLKDAEMAVEDILKSSKYPKCLGGKFVFVDLAGAEFFTDNTTADKSRKQTPQDRSVGRQINADLFALKEVIRARATNQARIPYRSSPLTMVLREHFTGSDDSNSAMILTVSPSSDMWSATLNTLKYGSLVGSA